MLDRDDMADCREDMQVYDQVYLPGGGCKDACVSLWSDGDCGGGPESAGCGVRASGMGVFIKPRNIRLKGG